MTKTCTFCRLLFLVLVCCALPLSAAADTVYELLTNEKVAAEPFADGDKIIIVADGKYGSTSFLCAMGPQTGTNAYRDPVEVTKNTDGTITLNSESTVRVVTLKAAGDYFYLYIEGEGYLYSTSTKSLKTNNTETAQSGQNALIGFQTIELFKTSPSSTPNLLQYNAQSPRFYCSTSTTSPMFGIKIYREKQQETTVSDPVFSPNEKYVSEMPKVTITTSTENAKIYYTLDETDPTEASTLFEEPFTPTGNKVTIKARAYREDLEPSKVVTMTYKILEQFIFTKVMSESELAAGDKIILVYEGKNNAMATTTHKNGYRETVDISIVNNAISVLEGSVVQIITLEEGTATEEEGQESKQSFRLDTENGVYLTSSASGKLSTTTTKSDDNLATFTFDITGKADIEFMAGSCPLLQFNSTYPRFACYASTSNQQPVQIYKQATPKECVKLSEAKALEDGEKFSLDAELLVLKKHNERVYVYDKNEESYALVVLPGNELVDGAIVTDKWNGTVSVVDGQKRLVPDKMLTASGEEAEFDVEVYAKLIGIDNAADLAEADAAPVRLDNVSVANTWTVDASATFTIFLASKTEPDPADGKEIKIVRRVGTTFKDVTTRNVFGLPLNAAAPEDGVGLLYDEILVFANATESGIEVYPSAFGGAPQGTTGIETITADDVAGETYFVDLTGRRVAEPTTGIYLKVSGSKVEKVAVK